LARRRFIDVPKLIYANDSSWVPFYRADAAATANPRKNPFFKEAAIQHFLAVDARNRPVGRIAGCIQREYNERFDRKSAFFGFFESVRDDEVAHGLLGAVERWAADAGMTTIVGPYSYCPTQDAGLLVDGFDKRPTLLQTYNPPYYPQLLEKAGYAPFFFVLTYTGDLVALRQRSGAMIDHTYEFAARQGFTIRLLDTAHLDREREILRSLFNDAFERNREVVPMSKDVFHFQTSALEHIVDPRLITIVERNGEAVAFSLGLPDFNEVLYQSRGRITPLMLLRWKRLLGQIKTAVVVLVGARQVVHGAGLSRILIAAMIKHGSEAGYTRFTTTWVDEENSPMRAAIRRAGYGTPEKRFGLYRKDL
jgi:hypothetical protein